MELPIIPDMSSHGGFGFGQIFLQTDVGQSILAKYRLGIQVGRHEATLSLEGLVWSETLHVGAGQQGGEVRHQLRQTGVHRDLVLPLELRPHGTELGLGAGGGHDVVHDVDVDVVENHHVPVAGGSRHVVHDVSKNDPILC